MNIKSNQMKFAALSLLLVMAAPVMAQTPATGQKGNITQVELSRQSKCMANGRTCSKPGAKAFEGRKDAHTRFGGRQFAMHRRSMFSSLRGEYALTNDQSEKLLTMKDQFLAQAQGRFVDLKTSKRKMKELLTEPSVDKGQVLSLQNQINGDIDSINNLKVETKLNELSVLTDPQKQQIRSSFIRHELKLGRG